MCKFNHPAIWPLVLTCSTGAYPDAHMPATSEADPARESAPVEEIDGPCIGIVEFKVTAHHEDPQLGEIAAEALAALVDQSKWFRVIKGANLECLLKDQGVESLVQPGELLQPVKIAGLDYLVLGEVIELRVSPRLGRGQHLHDFDHTNDRSKITLECRLRLALVHPITGQAAASGLFEYKRTGTIKSLKVNITGPQPSAGTGFPLDDRCTAEILNNALIKSLKKMRWDIYRILKEYKRRHSA